jgi:phosphatidate cytidylyltransferase
MARHRGDRLVTIVAVALAVGLIASAHFLAGDPSEYLFVLFVYVGTLFSLQWLLQSPQSFPGSSSWTATLGAAYYPAGLLFQAPLLRAGEQGREWTLYLLLVSFAADTCAFFVGRAIGKRPMAPRVSPSKTWEGAVGGFLGALAASFAAFYAFALDAEVWRIALMGGLIGVVGQAGGLVNSRLKRKAGVKDSGRLFPGHGGIVDRLDSIVFNLVVVYHFVR